MNNTEITSRLFEMQDTEYAKFQSGLIPNVDADIYIGVRTPELRAYAKELYKSGFAGEFLAALPHKYFEENQLHSFIISLEKDFDECLRLVKAFLPYIDNWATCDQLNPAVFKKNTAKLVPFINSCLESEHTYTVRFGILCCMHFFLEEAEDNGFMERISKIKTEEYYINMMRAWYFATALAKQYDRAIGYIEDKRLDDFTHKKTITKACESFRVTDEHKAYLRSLR